MDGLKPSTLYARTRGAPGNRNIPPVGHVATAQFSLDATFLLYSRCNRPGFGWGFAALPESNIKSNGDWSAGAAG
jgi:hypothetical protein